MIMQIVLYGLIVTCIFVSLYLLFSLLLKLLLWMASYKTIQYPIKYIKHLPFHLNHKAIHHLRFIMQLFATTASTALITFLILDNFAPLGAYAQYSLDQQTTNISPLGPKDRIKTETKNGDTIIHQIHDLVYFSTKMPFTFDSATVRIVFKNSSPDQTLSIGFKDSEVYHYNDQLFDAPFINNLTWKKLGIKHILYQKEPIYISADQFLNNPPKDDIVGTFDTDVSIGNVSNTKLPNYSPSKEKTIINTPLRGRHVLYAYLENEPFEMTIEKQDLNWYEDPDPMTIKIYKGDELVYTLTTEDDGITDNSHKVLPPQEVTVHNLDPKLLENGVYKIVIDASGDTLIKKITTNLHKIVFAGSIFLAGNGSVYHPIIASTAATQIYTNAVLLSARTYHHPGEQTIIVGSQTLPISALNFDFNIIPKEPFSPIKIPQNDVIMNGFMGYFSASPDQFFLPTPYHVLPISKKEDLDLVNYLITDYSPPQTIEGWKVAEHTYDLRSAYVQNGTLSWVIQTPGLKENQREVIIKNIEVTFTKKPWI